jgi:hypothetical protein
MARCDFCGAETRLYNSGTPVCIQCSDRLHEESMKREQQTMAQLAALNQPDNQNEA